MALPPPPGNNRGAWLERLRRAADVAHRHSYQATSHVRLRGAALYERIRRSQLAGRARDNQIALLGLGLLLITVIMASLANGDDGAQPGSVDGLTTTAITVQETPATAVTAGTIVSQAPITGTQPTFTDDQPYPEPGLTSQPSPGGNFPTFPPVQTVDPGDDGYPLPGDTMPSPIGTPPGVFQTVPSGETQPTNDFRPPAGGGQTFPTFVTRATSTTRPAQSQPTSSGGSGYPNPQPTDDAGGSETTPPPFPSIPVPTSSGSGGRATPTSRSVATPDIAATETNGIAPEPTDATLPTETAVPEPTMTPVPPTPTSPPLRTISGSVRWTQAQSPVVIDMHTLVAAGATLTIDPGVEVRFVRGARLSVSGRLNAGGNAGLPVRFGSTDGSMWDGIYVNEGGNASIVGAQIVDAGSQGMALYAQGGRLVVSDTTVSAGAGSVVADGSNVEIRRSVITGNTLSGAPLTIVLGEGNSLVLVGNSISGNQLSNGAPAAQVIIEGLASLHINGNLFSLAGRAGIDLVLRSSSPYSAEVSCNTFYGGAIGLSLNTSEPSLRGFNVAVRQNVFEGHATRGASGDLAFDVTNNWWGDPSGPYEATRNPSGRGDAVGVNLSFDPWLSSRPGCAP